jgi:hypothetical protein
MAEPDEDVDAEEIRRRWKAFKSRWVPCRQINVGITTATIRQWLDDEAMPSPSDLNKILGYVQLFKETPEVETALDEFYKVLTEYAGHVTPHGRDHVIVPYNFGTIGARMATEKYGVIHMLLHVDPRKWDAVFRDVSDVLRKHGAD